MENKLRFFWNGIKGADGKLQKATFGNGKLINYPPGTIGIYYRGSTHFSDDVRVQFVVLNESDGMTDYFEDDRIYVRPDHPLYAAVSEALAKHEEHFRKRFAARPGLYGVSP